MKTGWFKMLEDFKQKNSKGHVGIFGGKPGDKVIHHGYREIETIMASKVQTLLKNFDPYTHVAEKHNVPRDQVKTAAYHVFYTTNIGIVEPTKEELIRIIEEACILSGVIK